jgi:hypothetical protein
MSYKRKTTDLFISEEIRLILNQIKGESLIASKLLKKRQKLSDMVEDHVNYISISKEDPTKISYLTTDRILNMDKSDLWESKKRFQTKPGSFVNKVFSDFGNKDIEKFSSLFKSVSAKSKFSFSVIKGDEIKKYYNWRSYASERGSLGISCMRYDNCQEFFDVYTKCDKVSLLVMLNDDKSLMGRALLWQTPDRKIMDRIYTINDDSLTFHFKKWATENDYWYKSEQNWYNTLQFEQLGKEKVELNLSIGVDEFKYYPYMDTFKFIDVNTNNIFNYIPNKGNIRVLTTCDGSKNDSNSLIFDYVDRIFRNNGETVYLEYLDVHTHEYNTRWSRLNNKYILISDCEYCQELDDYIFIDKSKNINFDKESELVEF